MRPGPKEHCSFCPGFWEARSGALSHHVRSLITLRVWYWGDHKSEPVERPEAAQRELAGDPMAKLLGQTSGSQTLWSEDKLSPVYPMEP